MRLHFFNSAVIANSKMPIRNKVKTARNVNFLSLTWPPATYDVIYRFHSSWPSLNLSQNLSKGWTNIYWKHQVLMSYPLEKHQKNLMGGWHSPPTSPPPPPFHVRPRVNLFWYKVFWALKIKITQFPDGFRLKLFWYLGLFFLQNI